MYKSQVSSNESEVNNDKYGSFSYFSTTPEAHTI